MFHARACQQYERVQSASVSRIDLTKLRGEFNLFTQFINAHKNHGHTNFIKEIKFLER